MKDFSEIVKKLRAEDNLLNEILNVHFVRLNENSEKKYGKISISNIFSLNNKIIQNLKDDIILVLPAKKEIAYLSSIFSSLAFYKKNFQDRLDNFEKWLIPGTNVMLCSSGEETGKVYKFLGKKDDNLISIGSLLDKSINIEHRIDTLLQLSPIKENLIKNSMIGKKGFIPKPTKSLIDEILNIKSYDNPMLCKNKVIILTNFFSVFEKFLNTEILLNNANQANNDASLSDIIKSGQIDENGNINAHSVEPLMIYTKELGSVYEFSSKTEDEKIIICDDIKKLNENFPIIQQIKDNNKNFKFLIFAEENEYDYVQTFHEKNNTEIWKFSTNEIKTFVDQIEHEDFNLNFSFPGRAYLKHKNHISKKDFYLETEDTVFNSIDSKIKSLVNKIYNYDEVKKNSIRELISGLRTKMYELRDHIFGFPEELKEQTNLQIDLYFKKLNSMESYLDNELFDDLIEIGNIFKSIQMVNNNIFDKRLKELHENLKLRENDSKDNYAVLTYNPERKIYYKENIKNRWGIEANVINSIDNIKPFKSLIVPSELVQSKITKLLLNDNFENIYFIGSKSLKEEMNAVKNSLFNRWLNLTMNNERKCEILDIDKKYINSFFIPDQPKPKKLNEYENFFKINDLSRYTDSIIEDQNDEEAIKLPAFLIGFNGDCFALATESFSFKVFNSFFDPSAFDKKPKIIKKDYQSIKFGDIVLLRHDSDSVALDHEAILVLNNDKEKYFKIKEKTKKIPNIINRCLKSAYDAFNSEHIKKKLPRTRTSLLNYVLRKANYTKGVNNVLSLSDLDRGTICPRYSQDLKKIFKACEIICTEFGTDAYSYDEQEFLEIFDDAKEYKSIRQSAGSKLSNKLDEALKKEAKNLEFDGDPLRVDYVDGNIIFGSESAGKPEGYIVQVNNYEEPRTLKEEKASKTNRLLFL
tara:strand:+ start:415 stop:3183 length:2769 start_codon:yes stop_codon:yes gene_type:complete